MSCTIIKTTLLLVHCSAFLCSLLIIPGPGSAEQGGSHAYPSRFSGDDLSGLQRENQEPLAQADSLCSRCLRTSLCSFLAGFWDLARPLRPDAQLRLVREWD